MSMEKFSEFIRLKRTEYGFEIVLGGREGSRFIGSGVNAMEAHLAAERKIEAGLPDFFE